MTCSCEYDDIREAWFMNPLGIAAISAGVALFVYLLIFKILGLRIINSNEVAVVEKW